MLYLLASIGYWLALYAPLPQALQQLITAADLLPRWLVFLPAGFFLLGRLSLRKLAFYCGLTLLNIFLVLDLKLHFASSEVTGLVLKVGSYNTGGGKVDGAQLLQWYESAQLDVLLLQEARSLSLGKLTLPEGSHFHCHGQLCVLSRYPVRPLLHLDRRALGGWGSYAASYDLELPGRALQLVNVHLNTPRHALETQRAPFTNHRRFLRLHESQAIESMLASELLPLEGRGWAIVGGDFNLTQQSTIYRQYWSAWQNSFSRAGNGLGRTKHTRLLGVRIDHILAGNEFVALSSEVLPSMGGDHSPLVSTFLLR